MSSSSVRQPHVAVVGAGMAGLTCAYALYDAGWSVTIFEKSRGLGGRMATRMTDVGTFDHGAQYASARDEGFKALMEAGRAQGHIAVWPAAGDTHDRFVGVPGMSAMVRPLVPAGAGDRWATHLNTEIKSIDFVDGAPLLTTTADQSFSSFTHVAVSAPAPQAVRLLAALPQLSDPMKNVTYHPCWALLASFKARLAVSDTVRPDSGPIAWAARNSAKPDRQATLPAQDLWIVHYGPEASQQTLETDKPDMVQPMLQAFAKHASFEDDDLISAHAHRWRYAMVDRALGQPCLHDAAVRMGVCGDGLLGAKIEDAWRSGQALAQALLDAD